MPRREALVELGSLRGSSRGSGREENEKGERGEWEWESGSLSE